MNGGRKYIGDAVFAECDAYGIRLSTNRGGVEHWIYLDRVVWENLLTYVETLGGDQ